MKKLLTTIAISAALVGVLSIAQAADLKIGVVNYMTAYQNSPQGAQSVEALKTKLKPQVETLTEKQKKLEEKFQAFQKNASTMTKAETEAKQKSFSEDQQKFQAEVMKIRESEMHKEQALAEAFQNALEQAIKEVGEKDKFSMILNSQAVPYVSDDIAKKVDVTDEVVAKMKAGSK